MQKQFLSLRSYAFEAMSLTKKPTSADAEMMLSLGENYAKVLIENLNNSYNILDFACKNNGIEHTMHCIVEDGIVDVIFSKDAINALNVVKLMSTINNQQNVYEHSYRTFQEFTNCLKTKIFMQ